MRMIGTNGRYSDGTRKLPPVLLLAAGLGLALPAAERFASDSTNGWQGLAARAEIKPMFSFNSRGGPNHRGALVIRADDREGLDGRWEKTFPVEGGRYYRFSALRHLDRTPVPRRSALVRIQWRDAQGRPVHRDAPGAHSYAPDKPPVAEHEYPNDGPTDPAGWTEVSGVYRAPTKATKATVELHFRWAPRAKADWSEVTPVSYTHLDVYKRQSLPRPPAFHRRPA